MSLQSLLDREFGTIPELLRSHARERPDALAIVDGERRVSHGELARLLDRVAAALQRDGLQSGDVIAICAASSLAYAATFLGATCAGVAVAPLAPSSTLESLSLMVRDCGAKLLFVDGAVESRLREDRALAHVARIALDDAPHGRAFSEWLAPLGSEPAPVTHAPDATFNIIYSSGTTGTPKGIVQPNRMRWAHVRRGMDSGYGPESVTLISTPLYSNTTLVSFFPAIALGGALVLMSKFDAVRFLELAQRERVTHAMLVPVQYQRLLATPTFDTYDLSSFRMKFCTSAPFSAALKAQVLSRWPGGLIEYYGMTEGGGTCALAAHLFPDKLRTVGQPALGHDIRLIDKDDREVAPGELGEVVGRSPLAMMTGYHNQPDKTAEAEWFAPDGTRFIRTGDIGHFDADGFLTLVDRAKDMIISGGFNIYPSDLETKLREHPAVADAAVVGVPSERWGETPVAFVVRAEGQRCEPETLRAWLNERVGNTQRLSELVFVDALPRSDIGKVLKRALRESWQAR